MMHNDGITCGSVLLGEKPGYPEGTPPVRYGDNQTIRVSAVLFQDSPCGRNVDCVLLPGLFVLVDVCSREYRVVTGMMVSG
ncbi:hypothetical protein DPMN_005274 [Dreissena polymorpha]|uniref:Uncharacterized protein n=1 Tax=Dreissena polymorpha TaxID=45954 RepID=A0A9D4MT73_DREPO|nr:hypothetical protein DPMN_005274 [Dreissena polymorpha]